MQPIEETPLRDTDIRTIAHWLSPDYLVPSAKEHGKGDVVLGALEAYKEVRTLIKEYSDFIRWRDQKQDKVDLRVAQALRALGYVGKYDSLREIVGGFRGSANAAWSGFVYSDIPNWFPIFTAGKDKDLVTRCTIRATGEMLEEKPELNRAVLDGRVWQRSTPNVMYNFEVRGKVRSTIIDPTQLDDERIYGAICRATRSALFLENHPQRHISEQLLTEWSKRGFIASPAGAMVSGANVYCGFSQRFIPNGIPLVLQVNKVNEGRVNISYRLDHRCFDGTHSESIETFLTERITKLLKENRGRLGDN